MEGWLLILQLMTGENVLDLSIYSNLPASGCLWHLCIINLITVLLQDEITLLAHSIPSAVIIHPILISRYFLWKGGLYVLHFYSLISRGVLQSTWLMPYYLHIILWVSEFLSHSGIQDGRDLLKLTYLSSQILKDCRDTVNKLSVYIWTKI